MSEVWEQHHCRVSGGRPVNDGEGGQDWERNEVFDDTSEPLYFRCWKCEAEFHRFELNEEGLLVGLTSPVEGAPTPPDLGGWSSKWPEEDGFHWFFGHRSKNGPDEMFFVEVVKSNEHFVYITGGAFIYASGGAAGMWKKADVPALPEVDGKPQGDES